MHTDEHEHSQALVAAIDRLIEGRRSEIDGIVVTRGPGHFAGLRVGIATAEGLALALGVPLAGESTLRLAAAAAGFDLVIAVHPAGRGEFAVQTFRRGEPQGDVTLAAAAELGGRQIAGEGAGALGGVEIGPGERVRAALSLPFEPAPDGLVVPIYAREPQITRSRRPLAETKPDQPPRSP
ncbi:MAG: hypothetical protein Kow0010_19950 [Dehalococcoidia bacterium]